MARDPRHNDPLRRAARAAGALGAGGLTALALWPGGLGSPAPVRVTGGTSAGLYRDITDSVADAPGWAATTLEAATEAGPVVLGLLLLWLGWTGLRRGDADGETIAGVGVPPDHFAPMTPEALSRGEDPGLDKALGA